MEHHDGDGPDHLDVRDGIRVVHEIDLDARLDDVWAALTDPSQLAEWLGGEVALEVRPEAAGHVVGDDGARYDVLVTDVDDHRRVAWHWWDDQGVLSSVELTMEPVGEAVRLRVVETLVAAADVTACARRWERASSRLWGRVAAHAVSWR